MRGCQDHSTYHRFRSIGRDAFNFMNMMYSKESFVSIFSKPTEKIYCIKFETRTRKMRRELNQGYECGCRDLNPGRERGRLEC